jgi:hypothetical protein
LCSMFCVFVSAPDRTVSVSFVLFVIFVISVFSSNTNHEHVPRGTYGHLSCGEAPREIQRDYVNSPGQNHSWAFTSGCHPATAHQRPGGDRADRWHRNSIGLEHLHLGLGKVHQPPTPSTFRSSPQLTLPNMALLPPAGPLQYLHYITSQITTPTPKVFILQYL